MTTSRRPASSRQRSWYRTFHRWVGALAALFVLLLALTGIALNHSHSWRLDQRHVDWPWLLDLYGIEAPAPAASFGHGEHRATLLGQQLYFDGRPVVADVAALTGMITLDGFAVVGSADSVLLLTPAGELVERVDLGAILPGPIDRLGVLDDRAVLAAGGARFFSDPEVTRFDPLEHDPPGLIDWSTQSPPPPPLLLALSEDYRGRGLTIERLLTELHSGRIVGKAGPLLMDMAALCLIGLSLSGLVLWIRRLRRNRSR